VIDGHLFLIGFMGAGKSTVARMIAQKIEYPCIDLDKEIEILAGRPIPVVFAEDGEDAFRELEATALQQLEGRESAVVACGGGVVLRPENRALLKRLGAVVYLVVTAEEALARVGNGSTRPLLAGPGGTLAATALLAARETLYRSIADFAVDTVGRSTEQVALSVLSELHKLGEEV
jgi:shikimate kinase